MPRVVITQNVHHFDLSDVNRFGDPMFIAMPGPYPDNVDELAPILAKKMWVAPLKDGDYLALVGDPIYMAIAASVMSARLSFYNLLRYDKKHQGYYSVRVPAVDG